MLLTGALILSSIPITFMLVLSKILINFQFHLKACEPPVVQPGNFLRAEVGHQLGGHDSKYSGGEPSGTSWC